MMANRKIAKVVVDAELKTRDIISNLPESLLQHIISFLPTESAVSTCILSKTWQHLWKATTKLSFSFPYRQICNKSPFFVDQVLRYHSSNITSFYLFQGNEYLDAGFVKAWISAAVIRQVQEVALSIYSSSVLSLPHSLWNSNMLRVLKVISGGYFHLEIPSEICLSSLKSLHLENVFLLDDRSFNTLFSSLPNLEELNLIYWRYDFPDNGNVLICLPKLRRLSLFFFREVDNNKPCIVKVKAENVVYLDCRCNFNVDLFLDRMPLLSKGTMHISTGAGREKEAHRAINLLDGLCYAKSLKFDGQSLEALQSLKSQVTFNLIPTFINLTTLEINSSVTSHAAAQLIDILRSSPVLESVVIQEVYGGKWSRKPYPQCIERRLRSCFIRRFQGRQADILFVKFVLKAAKGLERLELCCTQNLCSRQKKLEGIMNQLKILPRASNRCAIKFVTL